MKKLVLTTLSITLLSMLSGCEMLQSDDSSYNQGSGYGRASSSDGAYRGGREPSHYVPDEEKYQMIKSTIDSHKATLGDKNIKAEAKKADNKKEEDKKKAETSQPQNTETPTTTPTPQQKSENHIHDWRG
ncbi:MAG: hypothetical protein JSS53_01510 [Proteobacteria bacterium]|nr:hypothetical protein [Pseudomonadota bacterium]